MFESHLSTRAAHRIICALCTVSLLFGCGHSGSMPQPAVVGQPASQLSDTITPTAVKSYTGSFADGAAYLIEVPKAWNRTFLLWSHGFVPAGQPNPPDDTNVFPGEPLHSYLLSHGYALGGSSFSSGGFVIHDALRDQIDVVDAFESRVGHPARVIAWGASLGGLITAGLIQKYPGRFSGAVVLSGIVAGSVGTFNEWLDQAFALNTLLASGKLEVVHITHASRDMKIAGNALTNAQGTPEGRARIDLVAALSDLPGWNSVTNPNPPEPVSMDYVTRETYNYSSLQSNLFLFFQLRQDFEARAGGNPSWNAGVDYRRQLKRSVDYNEVKALYTQAHLNLDADLDALNNAPQIAADRAALQYGIENITFNREVTAPVLTLHTTGDDVANVQHEQAYADALHDNHLVHELFVHRSGHLNFTVAEVIVGLQALVNRLDAGYWPDTHPDNLNTAALQLGPKYNTLSIVNAGQRAAAAFINYKPDVFPRPFDRDSDR